jgi:fumarylacetoacetase
MQTWVEGAAGSLYDIDNLPYGAFTTPGGDAALGVRIGEQVLDLGAAARELRPEWSAFLGSSVLNDLMAAGPRTWAAVRAWVTEILTDSSFADRVVLHPLTRVKMVLPWAVGDYVDFYASIDHATNVGRIFRPDGEPLLPNWRHLPVGYHGRSGSIIVSGTDVHRPRGQYKDPQARNPAFGPCRRLDIEAELGFIVGRGLPLGQSATTADFDSTIFGVVGVNDWSARDIQAWEYVPLGPHLAKSFATSVAAWVTPLAALDRARVDVPHQDPPVLPYLREQGRSGLDIAVEVELNGVVVAKPQYASMYWSPAQMLAHQTVNGASLRVGDFYASGTISGPERGQRGSFLELSWGGREPFEAGGRQRTFLEDGDEVVLRYSTWGTRGAGARIGLGEVRGRIVPPA